MSMFLPEQTQPTPDGVTQFTPSSPATTQDDVALMQRVFQAAAANPLMLPPEFMAYIFDYIQTSRLQVPIGQVFGWQRVATQSVAALAQIPTPIDGQIVLLRVGSTPYTNLQMIYDSTYSHWVSVEQVVASELSHGTNSSPSVWDDIGTSVLLPHKVFTDAGLTLYGRLTATAHNLAAGSLSLGIQLTPYNSGSGAGTIVASTALVTTTSTSDVALDTGWKALSGVATPLDLVALKAQILDTVNNNISFSSGTMLIKWVG